MSLSGDLTEFALTELLQVLSLARKSGTLTLSGDAARGTIVLRQGRLVDAEVDDGPVGEEAFFRLLAIRDGRFTFQGSGDTDPGRRTLYRPLDALLLEAHRSSHP